MSFGRLLALAAAAVLLPCCTTNVGKGDTLTRVTVRLSVLPDGGQITAPSNGDAGVNPSLSADGRYCAFESTSLDLIPDEQNGFRNIFIKDRATGFVENITFIPSSPLARINAPFSADNFNPCISGDGRFVAFQSTGFYSGGTIYTGTFLNIWVYDRVNQTFANATLNGNPGINADCTNPKLSHDGRYVTWTSAATNIRSQVGGGVTFAMGTKPPPYASGTPAGPQVYVTDLTLNTIQLLSHTNGLTTTSCNNSCVRPHISADGTSVVFLSSGTDLIPGAPQNTLNDVFVRNIQTDAIVQADLNVDSGTSAIDAPNNQATGATISSDGTLVVFAAGCSNWGQPNGFYIWQRNLTTSTTILVASDVSGGQLEASGDGQLIIYESNIFQLEVRNIQTGASELASVNISGTVGNQISLAPAISEDGTWVAFYSGASNLVADDTNGVNDIFARGPFR